MGLRMKIYIKQFGLDLELKNKGMMLDVYTPDGQTHLGDVQLTKTGLVWCKGKKRTGPKVTWQEFIDWMETP